MSIQVYMYIYIYTFVYICRHEPSLSQQSSRVTARTYAVQEPKKCGSSLVAEHWFRQGSRSFSLPKAMAEDRGQSFKRFSGEDDDAGKALKNWRAWVMARMLTIKDVTKEHTGPGCSPCWTLEACEHLSLDDFKKSGGDDLLWAILKDRLL